MPGTRSQGSQPRRTMIPMTAPEQVTPHYPDSFTVLEKCKYFTTCQVWPLKSRADPEAWLSNFRQDEMAHATQLLNSVLLFQPPFMNGLFYSAFQSLSHRLVRGSDSFATAQARWRSFVDRVIITHVSGENPSTTDSGFTFARKAKKTLGIQESQILPPEEAIERVMALRAQPVVFVDDFVGSGNQFVVTWKRQHAIRTANTVSFQNLAAMGFGEYFYVPLICTDLGRGRIVRECPDVHIQAAHVLDPRYSALHPDSVIWPELLRTTAPTFLREVSMRAGIPNDPTSVHHYQGFCSLGLTIAFEDSVPDATVPLLSWNENGWKPLLRSN